jgi:SAM-dependent methyltransferase
MYCMQLTLTAAARTQRRLWGTDPRAWASLAEPHNRPLFEAVLDAASVRGEPGEVEGGADARLGGEVERGAGARPGGAVQRGDGARLGRAPVRVLDVGCGTGMARVLAAARGAVVAGVDVTPGLLAIARERLPDADLREADMELLPFADATFDAVLGVNAFRFAGDPVHALDEAARVCRPGGVVVASLFAAPERSQSTAVHDALATLIPPAQAADHAPYALSAPGNLESAMSAARLELTGAGEVGCTWRYDDLAAAVHGLLCSAGGARAVEAAGEDAVRVVLAEALREFEEPATGAIAMANTFRWVAARR